MPGVVYVIADTALRVFTFYGTVVGFFLWRGWNGWLAFSAVSALRLLLNAPRTRT
jgi:hypothetical protein